MLTIADVSKTYGTRTLFADVSLFIARSDRYGLVGPNGAGKTTLFNLILGEETPDSGTIEWERGADFGFLPQESAPVADETIIQIATSGKKLVPEDDHDYDIDWTLEPRAKEDPGGPRIPGRVTATSSQRPFPEAGDARHLARLLVAEPSLLLLDEPTNHLDLEALLWFQDYLTRYPGGLVVISHDRAFLNAALHGDPGNCARAPSTATPATTDDYMAEKEARKEQQAAAFKNQQREIAHLQRFVDRSAQRPRWRPAQNRRRSRSSAWKPSPSTEPQDDLKRIHFKFPKPAAVGPEGRGSSSTCSRPTATMSSTAT